MTVILHMLLCLGIVVAQASLSTFVSAHGIYPDFCLVLACVMGFIAGEYKGLMVGLTVGLFQDLLAPGGIGLNMILKGLAGTLAGVTTHTFSTVTGPTVLMVTLGLSIGCGLASLMVAYPILDTVVFFHAFSTILFPQSLYNSLLALGIFWFSNKVRHSMGVVNFVQGRR